MRFMLPVRVCGQGEGTSIRHPKVWAAEGGQRNRTLWSAWPTLSAGPFEIFKLFRLPLLPPWVMGRRPSLPGRWQKRRCWQQLRQAIPAFSLLVAQVWALPCAEPARHRPLGDQPFLYLRGSKVVMVAWQFLNPLSTPTLDKWMDNENVTIYTTTLMHLEGIVLN